MNPVGFAYDSACSNRIQIELHSAADGGQLELVVELMRRGADVAAQDASGETAADLAQSRGHSEVVDSLRRRGDLSPKVTGAQ